MWHACAWDLSSLSFPHALAGCGILNVAAYAPPSGTHPFVSMVPLGISLWLVLAILAPWSKHTCSSRFKDERTEFLFLGNPLMRRTIAGRDTPIQRGRCVRETYGSMEFLIRRGK